MIQQFVVALLIIACVLPARAGEAALEAPYQPVEQFKSAFSSMGDRDSRLTAAIGLASLLGTRAFDEEARDHFAHRGRIGNWSRLGNDYLGTGIPGALLGAGMWIYGSTKENSFVEHAGQAQIETLLMTTLTVGVVKQLSSRERPNGDPGAFPSAHVANVFATGAVLNEFYGWKAGVPTYALGVLTALGRMQDDRHWLTDTVGGAAVAIFIGRAFARSHLKQHEARTLAPAESTVKVQPLLAPGSLGLAFHWEF